MIGEVRDPSSAHFSSRENESQLLFSAVPTELRIVIMRSMVL